MRLFESYFKHSASSTTASILNCCNLLLQSSRGFKIVVECFNQSWSSQHFWACFMTPYNFITLGICNEKAILNVHCVKDHHLHCFHSSHLNHNSIKLNPTKGSKGNFSFWYPEKYLEILKSKPVSSQSWGNLNNWHSKLRHQHNFAKVSSGTNIMPDSYQNWWWSSISWGLLQREKILRELLQHILARLISLLRKRWKW